jgi:hypothetical protein
MPVNVFKALLVAPLFTKAPPEFVVKWAKRVKQSRRKTLSGLKNAIKTEQDFQEKIARPTEKTIDSLFLRGVYATKEEIMDMARKKLKRAGKVYLRKVRHAFQKENYEQMVESGKANYEENWVRIEGPLQGYNKGGIKGLGVLGALALTGPTRDLRASLLC